MELFGSGSITGPALLRDRQDAAIIDGLQLRPVGDLLAGLERVVARIRLAPCFIGGTRPLAGLVMKLVRGSPFTRIAGRNFEPLSASAASSGVMISRSPSSGRRSSRVTLSLVQAPCRSGWPTPVPGAAVGALRVRGSDDGKESMRMRAQTRMLVRVPSMQRSGLRHCRSPGGKAKGRIGLPAWFEQKQS